MKEREGLLLERESRLASWVVFLALLTSISGGLTTLLGWALGVPLLSGASLHLVSMKPNTALCVLLSGLALGSLDAISGWRRSAGLVCITVVLLLGSSSLVEYAFDVDLGVDQLLFREALGTYGTSHAGRMSPLGAVELTLFAIGWLLARGRPLQSGRSIQACCLAVLFCSFLASCGYLYGAHELYGLGSYTQIAPHTAFGVGLLAAGLLASRPQQGIAAQITRQDAGGALVRLMLPASIVAPIVLGALRLWGQLAGFYGLRVGLALFACSNVVLFVWLTLRSGAAISRHDQQRQQAEDAVKRANEELEARVAERTRELAAANVTLHEQNAERARVAEVLQQGEQRYRSLARNMPGAALLMFDRDLRFVMAEGTELLDALRLSPEKLIGKKLTDFSSPNEGPAAALYRAALAGTVGTLEVSSMGREVRLHAAPVYDASGAITHGTVFIYDMTAFAQSEKMSKESEARMRGLSEAAFEGIALLDSGTIVAANSALASMFGRTREDLLRSRWFELITPLDRDAALAHVESGAIVARESIGLRSDGQEVPIEIRVRKIDREGRALEAIAIQDLSARRHAERARERSAAQFENLVEALPQGIAVLRDARYVYINPSGATTFGYDSPADLIGQLVWPQFHPDEIRLRTEAGNPVPVLGRAGLKEVRCLKRDGSEILLESISLPIELEEGPGILGITRDVTGARRAEAKARATTSLWRAILDGADHSIIATTPEGTISEFNPAAERMLGYSASEMVGIFSPAIIHDGAEVAARAEVLSQDLGVKIEAGFETFVANARLGLPDSNEWTYVRKDGSRFPVRLSLSALRGPAGEIDGYLGIASDISEVKLAEAELIKTRDAAERAMRARSDFLARMSHEIRTPMNGILGMTELALQTELSGEQRDYLEATETSAQRLLALINDILDFSKIDAGKLRLEKVAFRPAEICGAALRALAVLAQRRGLQLLIHVAPEVPKGLVGDPQRLAQILTNLVGNAIKFSEKGDIVVSLGIASRSGSRVELEVRVRDSGLGIPLAKQKLIFDAFSQVDEATTRNYGGTGLGLAICAQLVTLMGGQMSVQSELGHGSEFLFRIPLDVDETARATQPTLARLPGLSILLVDDPTVERSQVETMLKSWEIGVLASDAEAAVEQARKARAAGTPVSLIILNAGLARSEQAELIAQLRSESDPHAGIVFLGAMAEPATAETEQRIGTHVVVSRPVLPSALLEAIESLLTGVPRAPSRKPVPHVPALPDTEELRVLVADDNEINRKVVSAMLTKAGHRVTLVENGRDALAAIARESFDLVLMDVEMPVMDGFETTRIIRESKNSICIVALTAQAMKGDEERCLAAGMDAYLSKPIDRQALLRTLARVSAGSRLPSVRPAAVLVTSLPPTLALPIDEAELFERVAGDQELLAELVRLFLRDAPPMFVKVKDAAAAGDAGKLERSAHALASMLLNLSAHRASASARLLEQRARVLDLADAPLNVGVLETEMRALEAHFGTAATA